MRAYLFAQIVVFTFFIVSIPPSLADEFPATMLEIQKAYEKIPHKQTAFSVSSSSLQSSTSKELNKVFELVDQAIVARVRGLELIVNADDSLRLREYLSRLRKLAVNISKIYLAKSPEVTKLISAAILEQAKFLEQWQKSANHSASYPAILRSDPLVSRSSQKLRRAYSILMRSFANESSVNKTAFFDHLCALDFV